MVATRSRSLVNAEGKRKSPLLDALAVGFDGGETNLAVWCRRERLVVPFLSPPHLPLISCLGLCSLHPAARTRFGLACRID